MIVFFEEQKEEDRKIMKSKDEEIVLLFKEIDQIKGSIEKKLDEMKEQCYVIKNEIVFL